MGNETPSPADQDKTPATGEDKVDATNEGDKASSESGPDKGFPANTPVADMTVEQKVEYWKAQSRKHESEAKSRKDYDEIIKERDTLLAKSQTPDEKALADAKSGAVTAALIGLASEQIEALIDARVSDPARAAVLKLASNASAFVKNGKLDAQALTAYVDAVAPASSSATSATRDPNQGQKRVPSKTGVAQGMSAYAERHPTPASSTSAR